MNHRFLSLIGLEITPNDHREKTISGLGGFVAIAMVAALTSWLLGRDAVMPVVASMGASAVLLFAVPHGPLSQPWPLVGGHLISAAVGVTCARFIPNAMLAGAAAVGLAITLMYYGRCIHPPGGATALTAVLGGEALRKVGYGYVLMPVGLNVAVMLGCAVAFNYLFAWRRYPAALYPPERPAPDRDISTDDWAFALATMGTLADVSEDELAQLHLLAKQNAQRRARELI